MSENGHQKAVEHHRGEHKEHHRSEHHKGEHHRGSGEPERRSSSPSATRLRVGAVADIHCRKPAQEFLRHLFAQAALRTDVLLLCGDLTDYGHPDEARSLAAALKPVADLPVIAVLGNHDCESGKENEVMKILGDVGVRFLNGDAWEYRGVGFAGAKGFGGGFRERALQPWGEKLVKMWVKEAMDEALSLEKGLGRLHSTTKIAVLHYAPIPETVKGEPLEILPFLGSSRLEEPINRFGVAAVFHGHAHYGSLEGKTSAGVPVYNVALPLLRRSFPDAPLFRVLNFHATEPAPKAAEPPPAENL